MEGKMWHWVALAILAVGSICAVPFFLVTYPPLQDLPNHLGRILVLSSPDHPIRQMYMPAWSLVPNLATDLLLVGLGKFLSLALSSKLVLGLGVVLWLVAPFLIQWAVYRQLTWVPLLAGTLLFNNVLQKGFLNFFLGTGLLGVAFAVWVILEKRSFPIRIIVGVVLATTLYFTHLFTFAVFLIGIAMWELVPTNESRLIEDLPKRAALLALTAVPGLICFGFAPHAPGPIDFSYGAVAFASIFHQKLEDVLKFSSSGVSLFLAITIVLVTSLAAVDLFDHCRLDLRLGLLCLVLLLLLAALPQRLMGGTNVDWRMVAPIVIFTTGWLRVPVRRWTGTAFVAATLFAIAFEAYVVSGRWIAGERLYQDFRSATADIPNGSSVVYVKSKISYRVANSNDIRNFGFYCVIERPCLVPGLFAQPSQQPISVNASYLQRAQIFTALFQDDVRSSRWTDSTKPFKYVVVATTSDSSVPDTFTKISEKGLFKLYRYLR